MAVVSTPSSGSATCTVELAPVEPVKIRTSIGSRRVHKSESVGSGLDRPRSSRQSDLAAQETETRSLPSPTTSSDVVQRWNYPKHNIARTAVIFWSFVVFGMNDAAYGVRQTAKVHPRSPVKDCLANRKRKFSSRRL